MTKPPVRQRCGKWYFRIKVPDKYGELKWTERCGGITKAEAYEKYNAAVKEIEATGSLNSLSQTNVAKLFKLWFEDYIDINVRNSTSKSYHGMVNKHILPELGHIQVKRMNARIVQKFLNNRSDLSHATLSKLLTILKSAFSYAVEPCGYCSHNPIVNIRIPGIAAPPQTTHVFTPEQMQIIAEAFPAGHQFYVPINICYHTGLRIGEALGLRWTDIDFNKQLLSVVGTMTESGVWQELPKTKTSRRTIPFGDKLLEILKAEKTRQETLKATLQDEFYNKNNYVCCRPLNGRRISCSDMRYFNIWCKDNFGKGSTHSLRHTHATMLLEAGETLEAVSKRLGHSSIAVTSKYYSHVTEKGNAQMLQTLNKLL